MQSTLKVLAVLLIVALALSQLHLWYQVFWAQAYYANAPIHLTAIVGVIWPVAVLLVGYKACEFVVKFKKNEE